MAKFLVEKTIDYTVMSNFHLRDSSLSLKAKGLLSQMLSLPDNWDYTLSGLAKINRESKLQKASTDMADAGYVSAIKARRAALPSIAATAAAPASRTSADSQLLQQILEAIRVGQTLLLDGSLVVGGTANRYNATLGEAIMLTERGAT